MFVIFYCWKQTPYYRICNVLINSETKMTIQKRILSTIQQLKFVLLEILFFQSTYSMYLVSSINLLQLYYMVEKFLLGSK